jgi:hypothetical protein
MMACCDLCYATYLDEDGNVLMDKLINAITHELVRRSCPTENGPLTSKKDKFRRAGKEQAAADEAAKHAPGIAQKMVAQDRLCRCDCHVVGRNIIH